MWRSVAGGAGPSRWFAYIVTRYSYSLSIFGLGGRLCARCDASGTIKQITMPMCFTAQSGTSTSPCQSALLHDKPLHRREGGRVGSSIIICLRALQWVRVVKCTKAAHVIVTLNGHSPHLNNFIHSTHTTVL